MWLTSFLIVVADFKESPAETRVLLLVNRRQMIFWSQGQRSQRGTDHQHALLFREMWLYTVHCVWSSLTERHHAVLFIDTAPADSTSSVNLLTHNVWHPVRIKERDMQEHDFTLPYVAAHSDETDHLSVQDTEGVSVSFFDRSVFLLPRHVLIPYGQI